MNEQPLTNILNYLAEEGVPENLDLRITIHHRFEAKTTPRQKRFFKMKTNSVQSYLSLTIIGFALIFLTTLLLTYQSEIKERGFSRFPMPAQRVNLTETPLSATGKVPIPPVPPIPTQETAYFNISTRYTTLAEAKVAAKAAKFDILEFPFPLPGLKLEYIDVSSNAVYMVYEAIEGGSYLYLEQRILNLSGNDPQGAPQNDVEIVKIGNLEGKFIVEYLPTFDKTGQFIALSGLRTHIIWQDRNRLFKLTKEGSANIFYLDRENLIALATSLVDPSAKLNLENGYFVFLSVADAKSVTGLGFDIAEPSYLPDTLTMRKVKINMPQRSVSSYYTLGGSAGLKILQAPIANYTNPLVGTTHTPTPVQVGPYSGWFVAGVWDNGKIFRVIWWFGEQTAFEIYFECGPSSSIQLEETDLIALAESLH